MPVLYNDENRYYEVNPNNKDIFTYIQLGNSLEYLKNVPDNSVKLILTDPPYNIARKRKFTRGETKTVSLDFGEWDYFENNEEYLKWCDLWIKECYRILDKDGHIFIFQPKDTPIKTVLEENDFEIRNILVWGKKNPLPQFQKISFLSAMEFGVWATKNGSKRKDETFNFTLQKEMHNLQLDEQPLEELSKEELIDIIQRIVNVNLLDEEKNEVLISEYGIEFYRSPIVMGKEKTSHTTQKPLSFTRKLIEIFTNEGDVILDCFGGSGTTTVAAKTLNRSSISIEKEKPYFEIEKDRIQKVEWSEHVKNKPLD